LGCGIYQRSESIIVTEKNRFLLLQKIMKRTQDEVSLSSFVQIGVLVDALGFPSLGACSPHLTPTPFISDLILRPHLLGIALMLL
jgi:hypothetical protein